MKQIRYKITIVVGVLAMLIVSIAPFNALAYNTMTVSPPTQKVILMPGETYTDSLTVSNSSNSDRDLKYEVKVGSFSQTKEGSEHGDDYGTVDVVSESNYNQIMNWITLGKESGTVAPGQNVDVPYTIDVPENAPAGGQYATIIILDKTTSGTGEGNIILDDEYQFASIIYAEVAGETKTNGEILENNIPAFMFDGPLEATSMVKNNGNVHTEAEYTLQVWSVFGGDEICTNEEKPETSLILPETERYHVQKCEKIPSIGIFKVKQVVKIFGETSTLEKVVIVCPLWLLFVIIFVIASLIIWLVMRSRSRKKQVKEQKKSGEA